jgi:hypothetical protein
MTRLVDTASAALCSAAVAAATGQSPVVHLCVCASAALLLRVASVYAAAAVILQAILRVVTLTQYCSCC